MATVIELKQAQRLVAPFAMEPRPDTHEAVDVSNVPSATLYIAERDGREGYPELRTMSIFESISIKGEPETPRRERKAPWDATDSIALVASNNGVGCVLAYDGQGIECDFETESSAALDSHCLDIAPDGLSIWEGKFCSSRDYYGEYDCWLEGEFRDLTEREWELLRTTGEPWEYEPCPRCADDGRIRCPDADCLICMADKYCRDSQACPCGQQGWVLIDQVALLGDEEVREYIAKVGAEILSDES